MATYIPLVPDEEMFDFIEEDDQNANIQMILPIRNAVESWIMHYCDRNFFKQSYRERYDGDGTNVLVLRQYPITAIKRLSLWPAYVIRIANILHETIASVACIPNAVTPTAGKVVLSKDDVDVELKFSDYATFGLLVAAINAVGNGWQAYLVSDTFYNYKCTELIERMGLYCLEGNWVYLQMPYQRGELDFDTDSERGIIHLFRYGLAHDDDLGIPQRELIGFPRGTRNIFIDYTAGFDTIPDDLKLAIKIIVKYILQKKEEESWGTSSQSVGEVSFSFDGTDIPWEARFIIDQKYRKVHI
jgi:hypothetical protein